MLEQNNIGALITSTASSRGIAWRLAIADADAIHGQGWRDQLFDDADIHAAATAALDVSITRDCQGTEFYWGRDFDVGQRCRGPFSSRAAAWQDALAVIARAYGARFLDRVAWHRARCQVVVAPIAPDASACGWHLWAVLGKTH